VNQTKHHQSKAAIQQLTSMYTFKMMSTSRHKSPPFNHQKYLFNSHILLKYFVLVFFQLQLLKIWCKFIAIQLIY